jgi:hypothetical protein
VVFSAEIDEHLAKALRYLVASDRSELLVAGQGYDFLHRALGVMLKTYVHDNDAAQEFRRLLVESTQLHRMRIS